METITKKKLKKPGEEIGQQIDKQLQDRQEKFERWNKLLDEINGRVDYAKEHIVMFKQDVKKLKTDVKKLKSKAIKEMGYELEHEGVEKRFISRELIKGFAGKISSGYITATCNYLNRGWTDKRYSNKQYLEDEGLDLSLEPTVDELEFETKDNMDVLIHYWLDMDIQKLINIKHDVPKGENWRKIVFDTAKDKILNRWKQLDDMVVNNTVNHNRTLIEMLRYVNDIGHEEQKIRQRNKEMFGK